MKFKDTDINRIWDDVYDNESLRSDPDIARNLADSVKESLRQDNLVVLQNARIKQFQSIKNFLLNVMWVIIALIVAAAIGFGIYSIFQSNNNDYAGYGPNKVAKHNMAAIDDYFAPKKITLQKKEHGSFAGQNAWESQYAVDGKVVCVYVWGGANTDSQFHVTEGGC